jgi:Fic family protein
MMTYTEHIPLTQRQPAIEKAITAYMRGLSLEQAAREAKICKVALWREMRRRGYRIRTNAHSDGRNSVYLPGWLLDEHPRLTAQQIANIAGCSRNAVVKRLQKRDEYQPMSKGAPPTSRMSNSTKNRERVLKAVELSKRGLTAGQIGIKVGAPRSTVNGWLTRYRRRGFLWQHSEK